MAPEKRPVIAHIKARSKHSFLTINRNDLNYTLSSYILGRKILTINCLRLWSYSWLFTWARRMDRTWKFDGTEFCFRIKNYGTLKVSTYYVCIGKPCICNVFRPRLVRGVAKRAQYNNVTIFTHFCQNWRLDCLFALHESMHPAQLCGDLSFWTVFFCLVCPLLEKKEFNVTK